MVYIVCVVDVPGAPPPSTAAYRSRPPRFSRGGFRRVVVAGLLRTGAVVDAGAVEFVAVAVVVAGSSTSVAGASGAAAIGGALGAASVLVVVGAGAAVIGAAAGGAAGVVVVLLVELPELPELPETMTPIAMPAAAVAASATSNERRRGGGLELPERAPAAADKVLGGRGAGVVYADGIDARAVSASV